LLESTRCRAHDNIRRILDKRVVHYLRPAIIRPIIAFVALLPVESGRGSFFLELGKIIINLARWLTGLSLVSARVALLGRGVLLLEVLLEIHLGVLHLVVRVDPGGGKLQST